MKTSKLFRLLALGAFLSVASAAFVNTAEAAGTVDLGPQNTYKYFWINNLTFATIQQASGTHSQPLTVLIEPADGRAFSGESVWTSQHFYLYGWSVQVPTPYYPGDTQVLFENSGWRFIKVKWWYND